jgi:ribosome-associated heat shock protein Hsp15
VRIDKLLHNLRFAKTRGAAQRWIGEGHIRLNGQRVVRQDLGVIPGDVLTLPWQRGALVIQLLELPARRGPGSEAQACYRQLDGDAAKAIAGAEPVHREGTTQP